MTAIPFPPEFLLLIAIYSFLALSLASALCDNIFPASFPYLCQVMALFGHGQLWINYSFLSSFIDARFWGSLIYLLFAAVAVTAATLYVAISKRRLAVAGLFFGGINVPVISAIVFVVSCYVNGMVIPLPRLPVVPVQTIQLAIILSIILVGVSAAIYVRQERLLKIMARAVKPSAAPLAGAGSLSERLARLDRSFENGEIDLEEYIEQRKSIVNLGFKERTWVEAFEERLEGARRGAWWRNFKAIGWG